MQPEASPPRVHPIFVCKVGLIHGAGRESVAKHNGELVGRFIPCALRRGPLLCEVAQGEEQQLGGCFVAGKVTAVLHGLAHLHVQVSMASLV